MGRFGFGRLAWRHFRNTAWGAAAAKSPEASAPKGVTNAGIHRIRQMQEHFQKDNGVPVFLRMGARDQLLYRATVTLALVGLCSDLKFYIGLM